MLVDPTMSFKRLCFQLVLASAALFIVVVVWHQCDVQSAKSQMQTEKQKESHVGR